MDKKVFYGEYTLRHFLDMILKKNILLPDYQRHFVWSKDSVEKFLIQLKDGLFVPPVILGSFKKNAGNNNIILDGQQRLTSVLLGYLGIYPKFEEFKEPVEPVYRDGAEDALEEGGEEVIAWTFKELLDNKRVLLDRESIKSNIDLAKYELLQAGSVLSEDELESLYLGFSYIVPATDNTVQQQRFYSTVFRNINQQGVGLSGQESRKALYYLDSELVPLLDAKCYERTKVVQDGKPMGYDFVRCLAFLSQYKKQGNESKIAVKCYRQELLEQWYEDYINAVVEDSDSERFGKFSTLIGKENISHRIQTLSRYVDALGYAINYNSIIDADMYNFGLIYYVVICGYTLKEDKYEELKSALHDKIEEIRGVDAHRRSPGKVTYLRVRIQNSISVYNNYVNEPVPA